MVTNPVKTLIQSWRKSALFFFILIYAMMWHLVMIVLLPDTALAAMSRDLAKLLYLYILVTLPVAVAVILVRVSATGLIKKLFQWAMTGVFVFVSGIRVLDWGVVYFSGEHVNREFWYHAFYVDGTSFLFTLPTLLLILAAVASTAVFFIMLRRELRQDVSAGAEPGARFLRALMPVAVSALSAAVLCSPFLMAGSNQSGGQAGLFFKVPDYEVVSSFFQYLHRPEQEAVTRLDTGMIEKLRRFGIVPYGVSEDYPLLKKSVYVDPGRRHRDMPGVPRRPNVIIVIAESLNQVFLQEEYHGIKGLAPNYRDFMKNSVYFSNTLFTISPTIRGTIATLGSSMYLMDKIQGLKKGGGIRPPIFTRFLFISDVLKKRGYTNVHVQGGSGLFVGLADTFINKQSYDRFYGWESVELQRFASETKKKDWGIRDQDIFRFAASLIEKGEIKEPFLLTLSTLDMHPPYDPLYKHPGAGDNALLNSVYTTDKAFGYFWDYYKKSRLKDNTILIVIADHVALTDINYRQFYSHKKELPSGYQYFVFHAMHLPGSSWNGREVKTLCTNLDVAPTLFDVMNIDTENPFLGLSVFSERPDFPAPFIIGYYNNRKDVLDRLSEHERNYIRNMSWTESDQEAFLRFLEQLALHRAIYPDKK